MTVHVAHQASAAAHVDTRTQYAALCYRMVKDKPQILLVTSRGTGRWIVPKGWPIPGLDPAASAAREAWEEAGVIGRAHSVSLGVFTYAKLMGLDRLVPCVGVLYPVRVKDLSDSFPEKGQRRRKWFSPRKAAARVAEPELAALLRGFDPRKLVH